MGGYITKRMFLQLPTLILLLHLFISSSSGEAVNSSENGECVSKGGRSHQPYELEGKLPESADLEFKDLNLCNVFHGKTCCSASRMLSASLALQSLATHREAAKDCLDLFELLECSICHPYVRVQSSPLRICASLCDRVFEACSDAYFSTSDASNQVIVPSGASNGTICEKASKLETNGPAFCEAVGFTLQTADDSVEEPCYGSKRVLVTVVESFKKPVRLQDLKNKLMILNLRMCWSASVFVLAITLLNMWVYQQKMERDARRLRRNRNNHIRDYVRTKYSVEERKELHAFCKSCEADLHRLLENAGEQKLTAPSYYLDDGSISKYGAMLLLATELVSQLQEAANLTDGDSILSHTRSGEVFTSLLKELEHEDAKIGGKKKQNPQAQSKRDIKARDKAKAQASQSRIEEESVHEIFSRLGTVTKDWTVEKGIIIGDVVDQNKEDICWAIVLVRMLQAIYNTNLSEDLQLEFSIKELVDQIKPGKEKDLKLANLNLAFNHISLTGVMKKPTTQRGSEKAGAEGTRIKMPFKLLKDVNASFVQEKVDLHPVGLSLEKTPRFELLPKEQIYILPKKKRTTPENMHLVLIVGHGFTEDGQLYFIIQNSWGKEWGGKRFC